MQRPSPKARALAHSGPQSSYGVGLLAALTVAAAAVGFASYIYLVPYQGALTQLKRRAGELSVVQTEAETRLKEVQHLRHDVVGAQGEGAAAEGRAQADMSALKAQIDQRIADPRVKVVIGPWRMLVRFPEEAIFDSRGPWPSKAGLDAMQALATSIGQKAHRVVVAAPMGATPVPRWVRPQFPTPGDLSAARTGNILRALVKAGLQSGTVLAVIGSLAPEDPAAPATLDIEIEP